MAKDTKPTTEPQNDPQVEHSGTVENSELQSLRDEVAQLRQMLDTKATEAHDVQQLRGEISALKAALGELREARAQSLPPQRERPQEKLERRIRQQQEHTKRIEDELAAGPRRFQVSMAGESRMTRIVGARDNHEARAKYLAYFGIRGTAKDISINEVEPEVAAA